MAMHYYVAILANGGSRTQDGGVCLQQESSRLGAATWATRGLRPRILQTVELGNQGELKNKPYFFMGLPHWLKLGRLCCRNSLVTHAWLWHVSYGLWNYGPSTMRDSQDVLCTLSYHLLLSTGKLL